MHVRNNVLLHEKLTGAENELNCTNTSFEDAEEAGACLLGKVTRLDVCR